MMVFVYDCDYWMVLVVKEMLYMLEQQMEEQQMDQMVVLLMKTLLDRSDLSTTASPTFAEYIVGAYSAVTAYG